MTSSWFFSLLAPSSPSFCWSSFHCARWNSEMKTSSWFSSLVFWVFSSPFPATSATISWHHIPRHDTQLLYNPPRRVHGCRWMSNDQNEENHGSPVFKFYFPWFPPANPRCRPIPVQPSSGGWLAAQPWPSDHQPRHPISPCSGERREAHKRKKESKKEQENREKANSLSCVSLFLFLNWPRIQFKVLSPCLWTQDNLLDRPEIALIFIHILDSLFSKFFPWFLLAGHRCWLPTATDPRLDPLA